MDKFSSSEGSNILHYGGINGCFMYNSHSGFF